MEDKKYNLVNVRQGMTMDALKAIEKRKSVRSYQNKGIEQGDLDVLLKVANSAPKAGEFQISVVLNPAVLQEVNAKALDCMKNSDNAFLMERAALPGYQPMYGAPAMLVFSASEKNPYSMANVSNAATSVTIAATALGLGSCYVVTPTLAFKADAGLAEKTGIPANMRAMCCVLLGYQQDDQFATPKQQEANNINYCK